MTSPRLAAMAAGKRTLAEARIARLFQRTKFHRSKGRKIIRVKVDDLEALIVAAAVRQAVPA